MKGRLPEIKQHGSKLKLRSIVESEAALGKEIPTSLPINCRRVSAATATEKTNYHHYVVLSAANTKV